MWTLKNKINEQTKTQTHRYREQTDGCQRGRGLRRWVKIVKGIEKYKLPVIKIFTGT